MFWVVFSNIKFNAGSIQSEDVCKGRVNDLADRFGKIHHMLEHHFNKRKEVLFKACEERGIWDFGKAVEIPQFLTEGKEEDKKGIEKIFCRISAKRKLVRGIDVFPAKGLVKSVMEG